MKDKIKHIENLDFKIKELSAELNKVKVQRVIVAQELGNEFKRTQQLLINLDVIEPVVLD